MTEQITRSRLVFALVASVLLHLFLAGGLSGFDHTRKPASEPVIRAALIAPSASPPASPTTETPVFAPKPVPEPPPERPVPTALPVPPAAAPVNATAVAEAPEASTDLSGDDRDEDGDHGEDEPRKETPDGVVTPRIALTGEARLEFDVYRGESLNIGETRYHWIHDGEHYQMDTVTETTGLAGMLRPLRIEQRSTGEVTDDGMQPARYVSQAKQGKPLDEEVVFDRDSNRVMLRAGNTRSEHALTAGSQDMASLWLEIIWRAQRGGDFDFTVATGKRYTPRWFIHDETSGSLDTALGRLLVRHIQARAQAGDNQIEVWLAPNLRWLPVRIRYTDRKGDVYDQRVRLIEYENQRLRAAGSSPAATPSPTAGEPVVPEPANPFLR